MFFSIIIPTINRTRGIGHALSSLFMQTHPTWEAIIIDCGENSIENTIRPLLYHDRRIRYVKKLCKNIQTARALGISAARGEVITFLDADDYVAPTHLEVHHDFFTTHPRVDMVQGKPTVIGSPYIEDEQDSSEHSHINVSPIHGTFFIKEHVFDAFPKLPAYREGRALMEAIKHKGFVTHKIPMPTYIYDRTHGD